MSTIFNVTNIYGTNIYPGTGSGSGATPAQVTQINQNTVDIADTKEDLDVHTSDTTIHFTIDDTNHTTTNVLSSQKTVDVILAEVTPVKDNLDLHAGDTSIHFTIDDTNYTTTNVLSSQKTVDVILAEVTPVKDNLDLQAIDITALQQKTRTIIVDDMKDNTYIQSGIVTVLSTNGSGLEVDDLQTRLRSYGDLSISTANPDKNLNLEATQGDISLTVGMGKQISTNGAPIEVGQADQGTHALQKIQFETAVNPIIEKTTNQTYDSMSDITNFSGILQASTLKATEIELSGNFFNNTNISDTGTLFKVNNTNKLQLGKFTTVTSNNAVMTYADNSIVNNIGPSTKEFISGNTTIFYNDNIDSNAASRIQHYINTQPKYLSTETKTEIDNTDIDINGITSVNIESKNVDLNGSLNLSGDNVKIETFQGSIILQSTEPSGGIAKAIGGSVKETINYIDTNIKNIRNINIECKNDDLNGLVTVSGNNVNINGNTTINGASLHITSSEPQIDYPVILKSYQINRNIPIPIPTAPEPGYNYLYFKTDDKLYSKNSAGVEKIVSDVTDEDINNILDGTTQFTKVKVGSLEITDSNISSSLDVTVEATNIISNDINGDPKFAVTANNSVFTHDLHMSANKIKYVSDPVDNQDVSTKKYVDDETLKIVDGTRGFTNLTISPSPPLQTVPTDVLSGSSSTVVNQGPPIQYAGWGIPFGQGDYYNTNYNYTLQSGEYVWNGVGDANALPQMTAIQGEWIEVITTSKKLPNTLVLGFYGGAAKTVVIYGSNDGVVYDQLINVLEVQNIPGWGTTTSYTITALNTNSYTRFRFVFPKSYTTYIGLSYIRVEQVGPVGNPRLDMNSNRIYDCGDPVNAQDVATKNYVDASIPDPVTLQIAYDNGKSITTSDTDPIILSNLYGSNVPVLKVQNDDGGVIRDSVVINNQGRIECDTFKTGIITKRTGYPSVSVENFNFNGSNINSNTTASLSISTVDKLSITGTTSTNSNADIVDNATTSITQKIGGTNKLAITSTDTVMTNTNMISNGLFTNKLQFNGVDKLVINSTTSTFSNSSLNLDGAALINQKIGGSNKIVLSSGNIAMTGPLTVNSVVQDTTRGAYAELYREDDAAPGTYTIAVTAASPGTTLTFNTPTVFSNVTATTTTLTIVENGDYNVQFTGVAIQSGGDQSWKYRLMKNGAIYATAYVDKLGGRTSTDAFNRIMSLVAGDTLSVAVGSGSASFTLIVKSISLVIDKLVVNT